MSWTLLCILRDLLVSRVKSLGLFRWRGRCAEVEDRAALVGSFFHLRSRNTSHSFCVQYYTLATQGKGCWQSSHQLLASRWSFMSHIPSCFSPTVLCQKEPFWLSYIYVCIFNLSSGLSGAFVMGAPCSSGCCLGPKNQTAEELFPWVCHLYLCGITMCMCHWLSGKRMSGWSLEWSCCGWTTEGDFCGCSIFSFIVVLVCFAEPSVCLCRAFCKYLPMEINLFSFHFVVR